VGVQRNPIQSVMISPKLKKTKRLYASFLLSKYTNRSSSAPNTDAFGDVMQSLEVGPFGELVVFRCGRDVCADDVDGKVWDVGDGDLGAIELEVIAVSRISEQALGAFIYERRLTLATRYCRLLAMYSSTDSGFLDRRSPALYLSSKALFKGIVPVT
jgi:hypothetical protein